MKTLFREDRLNSHTDITVSEKINFYNQETVGIVLNQSDDIMVLDKKQALDLRDYINKLWNE